MRARVATALVASLALLATGAQIAGAEAGSELEFGVKGSHGYSIVVAAEKATAYLAVSQVLGPHARVSTVYIARAEVGARRIHATFGGLGTLSVRFRPSGRVRRSRAKKGCRGPDHFVSRFGTFVGGLDFEGEGGYTAAHRRRMKGKIVSPLFLECNGFLIAAPQTRHHGARISRREGKTTKLRAGWRLGLHAVSFAATVDPARGARFFASAEQSEGSLAIYRSAFALASPLTFACDDALTLAGVSPPAPFSGSGTFQRSSTGVKEWTGPLSVSFPGAPKVGLTGPQFKTQLIRSW